MAIQTLMKFLNFTKPNLNIGFRDGVIKNVVIDYYEMDEKLLYIHTEAGHELRADISNFKEIAFDSIASRATNENEFGKCLLYLQQSEHFNIYLHDYRDKPILDFYIWINW